MKTFKILFLAAALILSSCKKESPEPTPQNNNTTQNTSVTVKVSIVELSDYSPAFTNPIVKILDESGNVDTTATLTVDTTVVSTNFPTGNYCDMTAINYVTFSKSLPSATNFYRVQVFNGTTLIRSFKITNNNVVDEGASGVGKICNYSPHKIMVLL